LKVTANAERAQSLNQRQRAYWDLLREMIGAKQSSLKNSGRYQAQATGEAAEDYRTLK
jgi:hypothetical protein